MAFTSLNFLIFFPIVVVLFYITPFKWRWITLLAASIFFYINIKPVFVLLLIWIIGITYLFTRIIGNKGKESHKVFYLTISIILVLSPLFLFKYFAVINNTLLSLLESRNLHWPLPDLKYILPVGISFYTFLSIGYCVDVYNDDVYPERNLGLVALYISFFPLILSGPIERAKNMIPQFKNYNPINYVNVTSGLKLMLWGYFMKLVVADRIGIYVDFVYNDIPGNNGSSILIASLLYPFQVYADLGGYSLIAIGTSRVMGFKVLQNFRRPFFATSMAEFWRRWHISLISWLTDYVYTPLSFRLRRYKVWGIVIALMLTFLISGIWHGAVLTFIIWGVMQGTFLSIETLTKKRRTFFEKKYNLNKAGYVFTLTMITYLLFTSSQIFGRSQNINDAFTVYRKLFSELGHPHLDLTTLTFSFMGILLIMVKDFKDEYCPGKFQFFNSKSIWIRYTSYILVLFLIIILGVFKENSFIYFKF